MIYLLFMREERKLSGKKKERKETNTRQKGQPIYLFIILFYFH